MKTLSKVGIRNSEFGIIFALLLFVLGFLLMPAVAFGQDTLPVATPVAIPPELAGQLAEPWIAEQARAHPWVLTIFAVIGSLRVLFKPLVSAAHYFAAQTADPADDARLAAVERSAAFKAVAWLLDFGASIKLQRPPKPAEVVPLVLFALLLFAPGCTTFTVDQGDVSPERSITFRLRGQAWFSGQQAITQLKALQTDKSQSFGTDTISNRGPTNAVAVIEAATRLLNAAKP